MVLDLNAYNGKLRNAFFREHSFYTKRQAQEFNHGNLDDLLELNYGGFDWYPSFQFEYEKTVKRVLKILANFSNWQIALWFNSTNVWLENERSPLEQLAIDKNWVLVAATRLAESHSS